MKSTLLHCFRMTLMTTGAAAILNAILQLEFSGAMVLKQAGFFFVLVTMLELFRYRFLGRRITASDQK